MKKLFALTLVLLLLFSFSACLPAESYEDKLLGKWVTSSGNMSIMYSFEKNGDTYTAGCVTQNGSDRDYYIFDSFSASSSVITFNQDGKTKKEYYHFKDGYLYIDNLEFTKIG